MPDASDTAPKADSAPASDAVTGESDAAPTELAAGEADGAGAPEDLKNSFREALARKAGRNSHAESHLEGRHIGGGNNDTHKRQFRRKSG
jgi:uncharacterized protein DUF5302